MEIKELEKLFTPDYTPYSIFKMGIFCNGYWRPVYSTLLKKTIKDDYKQFDWGDLPKEKLITPESEWDPNVNKYKVKASLPLIEWERKGFIYPTNNISSYRGWVAWYCLYYSGERNPEVDAKQIKRWISIKNRFGKIKDKSPTIKQVLLQWAINPDKIKELEQIEKKMIDLGRKIVMANYKGEIEEANKLNDTFMKLDKRKKNILKKVTLESV